MIRRTTALLCVFGFLILLTACGGTAPTSSNLPDVSNESDVFTPDTTTTVPPTTTTTTTAAPTTTTTAPLTAEEKLDLQIRTDFLTMIQAKDEFAKDKTVDQIRILKNHGTWNGALVLSIPRGEYVDIADDYEIAGLRFNVDATTMKQCYLYKNREFKSIEGAYESGWITKEDVREIVDTVFPHVEWANDGDDEN